MANRPRPRMAAADRAKQFLPFAALKGLPEALAKIVLSEDMAEELDQKIQKIVPGRIISVVYFHQGEYLKVTGMVARFDRSSRILQVVNTRISLDDVLKVEV